MASESSIGRVGFFENAEVTTSGRPVLRRNEVECFLLSSVDLDSKDDPPRFTALRTGNLTLTTHRLIWIPSQSNAAVPSSLPLAAVTHIFSHKKSIKSMFHSLESGSKRTRVRLSSPSSSGEKVTSMAFGPSSGNAGEAGHGRKMIRARPRLPAQDLVRLRKAYKATTER